MKKGICFGLMFSFVSYINTQSIEWVELNELKGIDIMDCIYSEKTKELIILSSHSKIFKSKDLGESWDSMQFKLDKDFQPPILHYYSNDKRSLYEMSDGSIYLLHHQGLYIFDNENSWILLNSKIKPNNSFIGKDGYIFIRDIDTLFYSNNSGQTLIPLYPNYTADDIILANDTTAIYCIRRSNFGTEPDLYRRSLRRGIEILNTIPEQNLKNFIQGRSFNQTSFLFKHDQLKGIIYFMNKNEIFYSRDFGTSWKIYAENLNCECHPHLDVNNKHSLFYLSNYNKQSLELRNKKDSLLFNTVLDENSNFIKTNYAEGLGWLIIFENNIYLLRLTFNLKKINLPNDFPTITSLHCYDEDKILVGLRNNFQFSNDNGITWRSADKSLYGRPNNIFYLGEQSNTYKFLNEENHVNSEQNIHFDLIDFNTESRKKLKIPDSLWQGFKFRIEILKDKNLTISKRDKILFTKNYGITWKQIRLPQIASNIYFENLKTIYFSTDTSIFFTNNGGKEWNKFKIDNSCFDNFMFFYYHGILYWTEWIPVDYLDLQSNNLVLKCTSDYGKSIHPVDSGRQHNHGRIYFEKNRKDLFLYYSDSIYLKAISDNKITDQIGLPKIIGGRISISEIIEFGENGHIYRVDFKNHLYRSKYRYTIDKYGKIIPY